MKDSKLLLKILSALAAIVLWFAITYTEDPIINQILTDIDVVFEGEDILRDNGLIVVNKDSIPSVSAVIRGNRTGVIASVGSVTASVDLSGITSAGENTVPVKYNYPSSSVVLVKTKIKEITIETEKIVNRSIPVEVLVENADKNLEFMIDVTSETDKIRVSGAESDVYKIAYAKVPVDVTNITASGEAEYYYQLCSADGTVISETNILSKSTAVIPVKHTVYNKVSLPVKIVLPDNMAENYALEIKNQSVTTVFAGVLGTNTIEELYAEINVDENNQKTEYTLNIIVPEGVYLPEESREFTAQCTLVPKTLKEIEVPITAENVPEGKKVKITPEKVRVSAKGAENLLTAGNIKATVDASKLTEGEETNLAVELYCDKEIQIVGTYMVSVILE